MHFEATGTVAITVPHRPPTTRGAPRPRAPSTTRPAYQPHARTQTVHFSYGFQARRLYERAGYEVVGRVEDFPGATDVLWYRKRLSPTSD